jgi:hypothetical protein
MHDEMTPQELLAKIKHHECLDEDAINDHNQNPSDWDTIRMQL